MSFEIFEMSKFILILNITLFGKLYKLFKIRNKHRREKIKIEKLFFLSNFGVVSLLKIH